MTMPRTIVISYALIGGLTAVSAYVPPPSAAPPPSAGAPTTITAPTAGTTPAAGVTPAPNVDFVSTTAVTARFVDHKPQATFLVKSDYSAEVTLHFELTMSDYQGAEQTWTAEPPSIEMAARAIRPITLKFTPSQDLEPGIDPHLPTTGYLTMSATEVEPKPQDNFKNGNAPPHPVTVRVREVAIPQRVPPAADFWIAIVGATGALMVLIATLGLAHRSQLAATDPAPLWTQESWSSNLAVGTGVMSSLLAVTALPAQTHYLNRSTYTTLSALFAIMVALAPLVYGLLRNHAKASKVQSLAIFGAAAAITVWATLGQLSTAILPMLELSGANVISSWPARIAVGIFAGVGLLVVVYAVKALYSYAPAPGAPAPPPGHMASVTLL